MQNRTLQYPRLPLIEVKTMNPTAGGQRQSFFPIELCSILPNQRFLGKVNEDETTGLVQFASAPPPEKEQDVKKIHSAMKLNAGENVYMRSAPTSAAT